MRPDSKPTWRGTPRLLLLAVAATLSLSACGPKPETPAQAAAASPRNVTLTVAQRQHIHLFTTAAARFHKTIETTGVVDFDNDHATSVLAPFSGPVSRILVSVGQRVSVGQPLAMVDSPDFAEAIATYRKAVTTAQNTRRIANTDKDLVQHSGVSTREAQQAETDAQSAEADRDSALQALVALKVDPAAIKAIQAGRVTGHAEGAIRSPISGTVVEKQVTPGQLLQAGTTPAFTVANLSRMWVQAQLSGAEIGAVNLGDRAQVDTGGRTLAGVVTSVSALVNADTRAVAARVSVENPAGVLKKQMYVRVHIQARQETSGMLIPVSAILRDDENLPFVYVVQADGSYARQHVTLGTQVGDQVDVTGLQAGAQIVVDGGLFVQFVQTQ